MKMIVSSMRLRNSGLKCGAQRVGDALFHALVLIPPAALGKAERRLLHLARADVGRHDDDGVFKAHDPAAAVRQPAVVQKLQEHIEHVGVALFDLVEEDNGIGLVPYLFGELPARLVEPDVTRRRADELAHRLFLHILAHVQPHEQFLVAEQRRRERLGKLRLAHARGSDEDERAMGRPGSFSPARRADRLRDGGDGVVLPDDARVQLLFETQQFFRSPPPSALARGCPSTPRRSWRPPPRRWSGVSRPVCAPIHRGSPLSSSRVADLVQALLRRQKIVLLHGARLFGVEVFDLLFQLVDARRPRL